MMKKDLIILLTILSSGLIHSQVGINIEEPTATLDVNGNTKVRKLPLGSSMDDVIVTDNDGNLKKVSRDSFGSGGNSGGGNGGNGFSTSILGYEPQPIANKVVPPTAPGGATVTELGCKQWPVNGHYYCVYQLSVGTNFFNTFTLAKELGGYLTTLPNAVERTWVNTNIIDPATGYGLKNNIWIGMAKIQRPGQVALNQWVTGEEFRVNWSTNPASTENWFASGEPNGGTGEGFVHVLLTSNSATRKWNDIWGTAVDWLGSPFNQVIVEFNE